MSVAKKEESAIGRQLCGAVQEKQIPRTKTVLRNDKIGSLFKLQKVQRPRKIFVHVNNTNPMLDESSPQYREVRAAGWEVAEDGWRFDL